MQWLKAKIKNWKLKTTTNKLKGITKRKILATVTGRQFGGQIISKDSTMYSQNA